MRDIELEYFVGEMGYLWGTNNSFLVIGDDKEYININYWTDKLNQYCKATSLEDIIDLDTEKYLIRRSGALFIINSVNKIPLDICHLVLYALSKQKPIITLYPIEKSLLEGIDGVSHIYSYYEWNQLYSKYISLGRIVQRQSDNKIGIIEKVKYHSSENRVKFSIVFEDFSEKKIEMNTWIQDKIHFDFWLTQHCLSCHDLYYISYLKGIPSHEEDYRETRDDIIAELKNLIDMTGDKW